MIDLKVDGRSISPISSIQAATRVSQINRSNKNNNQDKLAVSENAQLFQNLIQKAKELPDIREEKVKAVSEQIAHGEFRLDAASIAVSMLSWDKDGR